ncbi:MAG: group 1 truncated hemoglobin [Verrucomicrobiota bacterium]
MKKQIYQHTSANKNGPQPARNLPRLTLLLLLTALAACSGCGTGKEKKKSTDFFTSGSREADQRASQRMAKDEQLAGSGEGTGEKDAKKAKHGNDKSAGGTNQAAQVEGKLGLFDRLGGEEGIAKIVDDFLPRAMQDPRVNWQRKGLTRGGFSFQRNKSISWSATSANIAQLKKHFVQFFALATGGPSLYEGKDIKSAHSGLRISNAEFDAAVGDLKASLDKLQIPNKEQKELLAIAESTRPQIVGER